MGAIQLQMGLGRLKCFGPPQPRTWAERDPDAYARLEAAKTGSG